MAELKKALTSRPAVMLDALLVAHAQLLFSANRWVGLLVLAATATLPRFMVLGWVSLLATTSVVRALKLSNPGVYVPYGYNALLVGYVIAHEYALDAASLSLALAMGALCALVSAALASLAAYFVWVPVLSVPFIVTSWFALGVAPHVSLTGAPPLRDAWALLPMWSSEVPSLFAHLLQGIGSIVLIPTIAAGACVLAAISLHSRISSMLAVSAGLLVLGVLELAHAPISDGMSLLTACNAALTAIALGGVWLVPSRGSFLLALLGAMLAAFFALGFAHPLLRLGLSLSFVPWNAAVILVLSALRQRLNQPDGLRLSGFAAESPEHLLLADITQRPLAREPNTVQLHLPFQGVWSCTQGVDGVFTHRDALRHAFDFEVYGDADGSLCVGDGKRPEDYRCYGLPVLAAADGTVMATEYDVPNNEIGEVSRDKPWGNHVTVQHAPFLFSVVAHLAPGTITVYPGQFVRRGTVLGYLGSSGRAPRPHLHFQMQAAVRLGSPTIPCQFVDVVARTGDQTRFEPRHVPSEGEALRALATDHALATYFDLPLGARLTYRIDEQLERVESDLDLYGLPVLRSIDHRSELVLARTESAFACADLRGSTQSMLAWLRLCVSHVPYDREPNLEFRSLIPERWLGGWLRGLYWDFTAVFARTPGIEIFSRIEIDGDRLTVRGASRKRDASGAPLLQTRAVLTRNVGPTLIEVIIDGRTQRAELLTSAPRTLASGPSAHTSIRPALSFGDWS